MAVTKVVMPKLSEAMESGKIIKWLKKEGDRIQGGDILAEVETDKADVEMEAFGAGVLRKILVPAGEQAPIGTLIGVIAEPGDDITALVASAPGGGAGAGSGAQKTPLRPEPAPAPPPGAASAATPAPRQPAMTPSASPTPAVRPAARASKAWPDCCANSVIHRRARDRRDKPPDADKRSNARQPSGHHQHKAKAIVECRHSS